MNGLGRAVNALRWLPFLGTKMTRWARTQQSTTMDQLMRGVRVFDMRVVLTDGGECRAVHTFTGARFREALQDVNTFLDTHSSEFVIIRLGNQTSSAECDEDILNVLHDKLLENNDAGTDPFDIKYKDLRGKVIVDAPNPSQGLAARSFPSVVYHRYDGGTMSADAKARNQTRHLEDIPSDQEKELFNLDWTLTPDVWSILFDGAYLLRKAENINKRLEDYLDDIVAVRNKIGVISVDNVASLDLTGVMRKVWPEMRHTTAD
jgi:hypothetical protein